MQTDATSANNSQHCWVLLANSVASICMGLKVWLVSNYTQQVPTLLWLHATDATSHSIVGSSNVGCCWPTMFGPFAWPLSQLFSYCWTPAKMAKFCRHGGQFKALQRLEHFTTSLNSIFIFHGLEEQSLKRALHSLQSLKWRSGDFPNSIHSR